MPSVDETGAAARPGMTDEERKQFEELQAKQRADAAAEAASKAEEEAERRAEEKDRIANRPLHHVLVRHMGRSARTRTMRASRSGHRRQGVLLDDGTRIRKKGKGRYTQVDLSAFVSNHERLLEYVRVGAIEVCNPVTEDAIPYERLTELIGEFAEFELKESGLQADPVLGSTEENSAPPPVDEPPPPAEDPPPPPDDPPPPADDPPPDEGEGEGEDEGYSEEELLDMGLEALKTLAVAEFEVPEGDVKKLRAKKDVVALIMAANVPGDEE